MGTVSMLRRDFTKLVAAVPFIGLPLPAKNDNSIASPPTSPVARFYHAWNMYEYYDGKPLQNTDATHYNIRGFDSIKELLSFIHENSALTFKEDKDKKWFNDVVTSTIEPNLVKNAEYLVLVSRFNENEIKPTLVIISKIEGNVKFLFQDYIPEDVNVKYMSDKHA